jgi:ornithine carbamoyltransferase
VRRSPGALGPITITDDVAAGVAGVALSTPTCGCRWGAKDAGRRVDLLRPYQVNADLLGATGNRKAVHALPPAFRDPEHRWSKR